MGCSPTGHQNDSSPAQVDNHFTCAAMISAADHLVAAGRVTPDSLVAAEGLMASMTHLNAWAIPKNIPEQQAFEEVNAERERLVATLAPTEILARAHACIEQVTAPKRRQ